MLDSTIVIGLFAAFCLIGYILGQLKSNEKSTPIIIHTEAKEKTQASRSVSRQRKTKKSEPTVKTKKSIFEEEVSPAKITIDDRIMVTGTETVGMEKKFSELGKTTESEDNISSSVNKLKNLKG